MTLRARLRLRGAQSDTEAAEMYHERDNSNIDLAINLVIYFVIYSHPLDYWFGCRLDCRLDCRFGHRLDRRFGHRFGNRLTCWWGDYYLPSSLFFHRLCPSISSSSSFHHLHPSIVFVLPFLRHVALLEKTLEECNFLGLQKGPKTLVDKFSEWFLGDTTLRSFVTLGITPQGPNPSIERSRSTRSSRPSTAAIHHSITLNSIMLRSTLRRATRLAHETSVKSVNPRIIRRYASGHAEKSRSSDLPWAIPSLAITVPVVSPPVWWIRLIKVFLVVVYDSQDGGRSPLGT